MNTMAERVSRAVELVAVADSLLIKAGAGMGVDSGLPDFRGNEGFWRAYPALENAGIDFPSIANPSAFMQDPRTAWGFYGHRLALYRHTKPHAGFATLRRIADTKAHGAFVVTSNVDGQFQKAAFPAGRVLEIHGSIHHLQCCTPCRDTIWSAQFIEPEIDTERVCWSGAELPRCDDCGKVARPNILMFEDWTWLNRRTVEQRERFAAWQADVVAPVVVEMGAGIDLPTIRHLSQRLGAPLIRINPRHPEISSENGVSLPLGALEALTLIAAGLEQKGVLDAGC